MDRQLDHDAGAKCERCEDALTTEEVRIAAEDHLEYCTACREALARMRTAVKKTGKFRAGI